MQILIGIVVLGIFIASIFFQANIYEFFGTKMENAKSNVMQNNIAYQRGKVEHLTRLKLEYKKESDDTVKKAIKEAYIQELITIDNNKLPMNLLNIED